MSLLPAALSAADPMVSWSRYSNVRYGCFARRPPSFRASCAPEVDDGRILYDGVANLRAHGGYANSASPTAVPDRRSIVCR